MKMLSSCLQLDVGNSSAKWRLVVAGEIVARGRYIEGDKQSLIELTGSIGTLEQIWISSVASDEAELRLARTLIDTWDVQPWYARTGAEHNGLINSYREPSRMGVDRWLAMVAAHQRVAERLCVVDAGSALTIDIVSANGRHEGGYIIPGPELMERALLLDTDRVRFEEEATYALGPGKSTAQAVRHGVAVSQVGAVRLVLERESIAVEHTVICGGGGAALQQLLGNKGLYEPDLVFEGLEQVAAIL